MREAPAGATKTSHATPPTAAGGPLPALAGGSPELDAEGAVAPTAADDAGITVTPSGGLQPEVVFVAVLAGAATIFFGIIPQPLFDLVHQAGGALGLF